MWVAGKTTRVGGGADGAGRGEQTLFSCRVACRKPLLNLRTELGCVEYVNFLGHITERNGTVVIDIQLIAEAAFFGGHNDYPVGSS